jgi:hypothetical protein
VPVLMLLEMEGASIETYERLNEIMGIHGDADAPEGLIEHVAAEDENAVVIADVWESAEAFENFVETRLGPALAEAEAPEAQPQLMPVHNRLTGKSDEAGVLVLIDVEDFDADTYDAMTESMEAHQAGEHPSVAHTAAHRDGGGIIVVDVWGSPEQFGEFAEQQVGPAAQKAGMTSPIEPRMVPVKKRIKGKAAQGASS